jgi:hypothetical protein
MDQKGYRMDRDDKILRTAYLYLKDDTHLRSLCHTIGVTKSDLIQAAVSNSIDQWMGNPELAKEAVAALPDRHRSKANRVTDVPRARKVTGGKNEQI